MVLGLIGSGFVKNEGAEVSPDGPTEERVIWNERFQGEQFDFRSKIIFTRFDSCEFVKCTLLIDHETAQLAFTECVFKDCNIDKLDWDYMQPHMRVYAAYLWELCTAPVLPFTYTPVAEQIVKRLQELEKAGASVGIGAVLARSRAFSTAAQKFDARSAAARAAFEAGKGNEREALLLNRTMKRVSRLTVPLMSSAIGKYGHDPYGYTPQGTMIPALYDLVRLATLGEGEDRWMLETRAIRDRNRVSDALSEAIAIIEDALA